VEVYAWVDQQDATFEFYGRMLSVMGFHHNQVTVIVPYTPSVAEPRRRADR